jgi:glycosyltransferase 2 family protein
MTDAPTSRLDRGRRWLPWLGALIGIGALGWVLRRFDLDRFVATLASADVRFVALVPVALMCEQLVRGWKWRQLLHPLRPGIGTLRLFGAIMAGYLLAILVPFGFGTVARSWLVARREDLKLAAVLATVAIDRLTDGLVFACLVPITLAFVAFPDPTGGIRAGLIWGGAGSFVLFVVLALVLMAYRRDAMTSDGHLLRFSERLPHRLAPVFRKLVPSFAEGIAWPREAWRGFGIVIASVLIKLLATTNFLWAGLSIGVTLRPAQYLFLIVFLGFLVIFGHFARVAGGFVIGAVFALGLLGVAPEPALVMALIVEAANLLSVACAGAFSLWCQGVALADVRAALNEQGGSDWNPASPSARG